MKSKPKKKAKPLSRLDKQGAELAAQSKALMDTGHRITRLECRVDKADATLARELFAIREAFQLTDEWRNRALKAEHALSLGAAVDGEALNKLVNEWSARAVAAEGSLKYAQDTLDQFKREDEARALAIREIVRPMGFNLFAPMDAVREMAKLTFSLRDELASLRAANTEDFKKRFDEAVMLNERAIRAMEEKSNLDKPAVQEEQPWPDCHCVRYTQNPSAEMVTCEVLIAGEFGQRRALVLGGCKTCGGTGYRHKDSPGPLPPDAEQSATSPSRLDVGQFRATEGELKEALKLWHEGKVCTCPGGQQHHRVGNSECYYEPRKEGWKPSDPVWPPRKQEAKEKPLRLLVEIVSKQDDKHDTTAKLIAGGAAVISVNIPGVTAFTVPCPYRMSIQELPDMPTLESLAMTFTGAYHHKADTQCGDLARMRLGLRAVLAACGLEVE